jgi:cytoplasmic iron level regulating protein YaaA (DUF328/UPF0246 family)
MRVALVSCVKSKQAQTAPAKDLYTSTLFRSLRRYAELNADAWYILSAEHGLVEPGQILAPYKKTLNNAPKAERHSWAARVQSRLKAVLPAGAEVVMLAGERYREGLVPFLESRGRRVSIPLQGMPFGKQLQYLNHQNAAKS